MAAAVSPTGSASTVDQSQFLQLLVAQLQNQDPLNPVDSSTFINQLTSLNQLQGIESLNASFSQVLQLQQLTQGVNLIGKTVEYTPTAGGANVTGTVDSVSVNNGNYVLNIGKTQIGLNQVVTVS